MKSIDEDIKNGKFKNIYFLIGVERYLIRQYRNKLVKAMVGEDDGINYRMYSAQIPDMNELIGFLDTVPFFAERRVAVIEDTGIFKSNDNTLAEYLPGLPDTSHIIFVEAYRGANDRSSEKKYEQTLVDKRYKLYKAVQKQGRIIEFARMSRGVLNKWLVKRFADADLNITRNALECLYDYVGEDMSMLYNESEKLICYRLGHKSIDIDDVKAICTRNIANDVFEMVRAIAAKNKRKALGLYYDLLELRERPMGILFMISREFKLLLQIKMLKNEGAGREKMKQITGLPGFAVDRYLGICAGLGPEYIREALCSCADTEALFKQGRLNDVMGVEMLIVKYST